MEAADEGADASGNRCIVDGRDHLAGPGARVGRHYPDIGLFEDIARVAERGLLDSISSATAPEFNTGRFDRGRAASALPGRAWI
jgi:hypothetical protein